MDIYLPAIKLKVLTHDLLWPMEYGRRSYSVVTLKIITWLSFLFELLLFPGKEVP